MPCPTHAASASHPSDTRTLGGLTALVSEGVAVSNAPAWHTRGYIGGGIKVGILDVGFRGHAALQGSELPVVVTARSFVAGEESDVIDRPRMYQSPRDCAIDVCARHHGS